MLGAAAKRSGRADSAEVMLGANGGTGGRKPVSIDGDRPGVPLGVAWDHAVDLDSFTRAGVEIDSEHRRRAPQPRAHFAFANEVRGPL
jgi:hypothetical protein